jgi:hypothetical protein
MQVFTAFPNIEVVPLSAVKMCKNLFNQRHQQQSMLLIPSFPLPCLAFLLPDPSLGSLSTTI